MLSTHTHTQSVSATSFKSGTPSGLRGTLNELGCGKVSIFGNGEEDHSESNESRNIHFDLTSDHEFCAILRRNEHRDAPEQVV